MNALCCITYSGNIYIHSHDAIDSRARLHVELCKLHALAMRCSAVPIVYSTANALACNHQLQKQYEIIRGSHHKHDEKKTNGLELDITKYIFTITIHQKYTHTPWYNFVIRHVANEHSKAAPIIQRLSRQMTNAHTKRRRKTGGGRGGAASLAHTPP